MVCYDAEFWDAKDCTNTQCPFYNGQPCQAAAGCGGHEDPEERFVEQERIY